MASATGSFEIISAGEDPYHDVSGEPKLARAHGTQRFTGDIKGEGSVEWLMCYLPDGTARFVGHQRIAGSVAGRTGTFVVEAVGKHDGKQSEGTWMVIVGSGTGELSGLSGGGGFHALGGPHVSYTLEHDLG